MPCPRERKPTVIKIKVIPKTSSVNKSNKCIKKSLKLPLEPFHRIQALHVCAKYRIHNGIITTTSLLYDIASVVVSLIIASTYVYSKLDIQSSSFVNFGHISLTSIGYFIICCNNIIHKHENVLLAVQTNKLKNFFKNDAFNNRFTIHNWKCVIIFYLFYTLVNIYFVTYFGTSDMFELSTNYCMPLFDMTTLHAAAFIKFSWECLELWLEEVRNTDLTEQLTNDRDWDKMFEVYLDILNVYKLTEQAFGPLICYFLLYTFIESFFNVTWILSSIYNTESFVDILAVTMFPQIWLSKNMLLVTYLCVQTEKMYSKLNEVFSVINLLRLNKRRRETRRSGDRELFFKNIHRACNACFNKLSAWRLTDVDGNLPLRLISLVATYIVVQLQFLLLDD